MPTSDKYTPPAGRVNIFCGRPGKNNRHSGHDLAKMAQPQKRAAAIQEIWQARRL